MAGGTVQYGAEEKAAINHTNLAWRCYELRTIRQVSKKATVENDSVLGTHFSRQHVVMTFLQLNGTMTQTSYLKYLSQNSHHCSHPGPPRPPQARCSHPGPPQAR